MSGVETVEFTWRLAESLWREGDYRGARAELRPLLREHSALSTDVVIGTSVMISIVETWAEDYGAAVRVLKDTEGMVRACRTPVLAGKWCHARALTCRALRDYDAALSLYEEAASKFADGRAHAFAAVTRNNIGNLYLSLGQPDIAQPYIEQAISGCEDEITLAQFRATRARLRCALGDYDGALVDASESAEFLQMMGETTFAGESLKTLGEVVLAEMKARVRR